ncbi:MAG: glycosyltransferase [Thermoanaerobaculia bacterium]
MRVAHHFPGVPPPDPRRDAVLQEAFLLRELFSGPDRFHGLGGFTRGRIPATLQARWTRRRLAEVDADVDLHHLFADRLEWTRRFAGAGKPLVCTLTTGLGDEPLPAPTDLPRLAALVVSDDDQAARLAQRGFPYVTVVPSPAHLDGIQRLPAPPPPPLALVAGSAPWTRRQFASKGVDLLLAAARRRPELSLTFLWRGVLEDAMARRHRRTGLGDRVRVVRERVAVGALLAASHAAVVLAARPRLVKAYPHSLLEALAAGRPILASACLPIAVWAERHGCGIGVPELSTAALEGALDRLESRYRELQRCAAELDLSAHAPARYRAAMTAIYRRAAGAGA